MKTLAAILSAALLYSCNVNVDHDENKDSASRLDSFIEKADTTLERWGDSTKEKYKDVRDRLDERLDRDSAEDRKGDR